jgi:uncharacterized protein (DUF2164 family)
MIAAVNFGGRSNRGGLTSSFLLKKIVVRMGRRYYNDGLLEAPEIKKREDKDENE